MEFDSSMPTNDFHVWLQLKGLSEDDLRALKCMKSSLCMNNRYHSIAYNYASDFKHSVYLHR